MNTEVIIFDLFGTLVRFDAQRHPYRQLLKWGRKNGRKPLADDARTIMTFNGDIQLIADHMGINAPSEFLRDMAEDIEYELASLTLFDDVIPVLDELKKRKIRMAICSNLAKPYGDVIERLLLPYSLKKYLSYECGFIKPEPKIYQSIVMTMDIEPQQCLFVGDTFLADVIGPKQVGMQSVHLCRGKNSTQNGIKTLVDLVDIAHSNMNSRLSN